MLWHEAQETSISQEYVVTAQRIWNVVAVMHVRFNLQACCSCYTPWSKTLDPRMVRFMRQHPLELVYLSILNTGMTGRWCKPWNDTMIHLDRIQSIVISKTTMNHKMLVLMQGAEGDKCYNRICPTMSISNCWLSDLNTKAVQCDLGRQYSIRFTRLIVDCKAPEIIRQNWSKNLLFCLFPLTSQLILQIEAPINCDI